MDYAQYFLNLKKLKSFFLFFIGFFIFFQDYIFFEIFFIILFFFATLNKKRSFIVFLMALSLSISSLLIIMHNGLEFTRGRLVTVIFPILINLFSYKSFFVEDYFIFIKGMIFGAIFFSILSFLDVFVTHGSFVLYEWGGELKGFCIEPNILAPIYLFSLIAILCYEMKYKVVFLFISFVSLYYTGSRTTIFLSILILFYLIFLKVVFKQKFLKINKLISFLMIVFLIFLPFLVYVFFISIPYAFNDLDIVLREYDLKRIERYYSWFKIYLQNPFGLGLDNYPIFAERFWRPHNTLLSMLFVYGPLGGVILFIILVVTAKKLIKNCVFCQKGSVCIPFYAMYSVIIITLFIDAVTWLFFWLLLALILSYLLFENYNDNKVINKCNSQPNRTKFGRFMV